MIRSTAVRRSAATLCHAGVLGGAVFALSLMTGCTTKNYVRKQTAPVINGTNELEDKTAANTRALADLDAKTSAGIGHAQSSADTAQQAASAAGIAAGQAQASAQDAVHRADTLGSVVSNLNTYQQVSTVSVHFGFNKSVLTREDKQQLDGIGAQLQAQRSYILALTGGTDSSGSAAYNYQLSDKRADAVVQYLASRYGVPPHRFYLIGLGKDQEIASNNTASGREQNRRVQVQLLTNQPVSGQTASSPAMNTAAPGSAPSAQ